MNWLTLFHEYEHVYLWPYQSLMYRLYREQYEGFNDFPKATELTHCINSITKGSPQVGRALILLPCGSIPESEIPPLPDSFNLLVDRLEFLQGHFYDMRDLDHPNSFDMMMAQIIEYKKVL